MPAIGTAISVAAAALNVGAGIGAAIGAGFGYFASTFVGKLVIGAALSLAGQLLQEKPKGVRPQGIQTEQTTTGDVTPQKFIVGTYATEGHAAAPSYTYDSDRPNRYLVYILEISDIPVEGLTDRIIIDGEYTSYAPDPGFDGRNVDDDTQYCDDYGTSAFFNFYDGTQTVSSPRLSRFSTDPERPWTSDHKLLGVAYAVVQFYRDPELFSGFPSVRFEVKGIKLYDPRKDTSVGGSGAHRWDDPSTYEWTDNPQVINYNILRGITLSSGEIYGGEVPAEDLPLDNWFAAMNECDVLIGSRKQFVAGFEINTGEMEPFEVIKEMNRACFAQMVEYGGVYRVRVGPPAAAVMHLTDDDFMITEPSNYVPFPTLDETHNAITGTYVEPADVWQSRSAEGITNATWEADDQDRRLPINMDMPAVSDGSQAKHLLNAYLNDNRRFRMHTMGLPPSFGLLEPLDTITWTSENYGYTDKVFEIVEIEDRPNTALQIVKVRERDAGDVDWTSGQDVPQPADFTVYTPPVAIPLALTATQSSVKDQAGDGILPAILLSWTGIELDDELVRYEVRRVSDQSPATSGVVDGISGVKLVSEGLAGDVEYEARVRPASGPFTSWSSWESVTTLAISAAGGLVLDLTATAFTIPSDPDGGSPDFTNATSTVRVLNGAADDTANWTLAKVDSTGVTSTLTSDVIDITGLTVDQGYVEVQATRTGFPALSSRISIAKIRLPQPAQAFYQAQIYQRDTSAPTPPTGGTFDFSTGTLTPPSGWSVSAPSGSDPLYGTQFLFARDTSDANDPVVTAGSWATPIQLSAEGADGQSLVTLSIYRRLSGTPSTPTGGSYDFSTQTLSNVPGNWFTTIPAGTDPVWLSQALAAAPAGGVDPALTWTNPVVIARDGQDGDDGQDGADGSAGKSVYTAIVFKRDSGTPSAPSGGDMNFGTNTLTPPTDWFLDIPGGSSPIWGTRQVFSIIGDTGTDNGGAWSTPFEIAEDGADGLDGQPGADGISTFQATAFRRSASAPSSPSGGSYDFGTQTFTPPPGWSASVPSGTDPVYSITALASTQGTTGTHNFFSTWSTPTILAENGQDGADGTDGTNGDDGATGDTVVTGRVYYQTLQSSAPSTPSASSYNTSNGVFTGLTSGWDEDQPDVDATDTSVQEWSSRFTVTIDGVTSAQTISFASPTGAIQFATTIESDNFVAGTSGWQIERDTGSAEFGSASIRGTLSASQIQIDNVTLDSDGSGNLIIKSGGVDSNEIALNGVTISSTTIRTGSSSPAGGVVTSSNDRTVGSTTVSTEGGDVRVQYEFVVEKSGANASGLDFQIFRNGSTNVRGILSVELPDNSHTILQVVTVDTPGSGSNTYTLEVGYTGTSGDTYTIRDASTFILETKR